MAAKPTQERHRERSPTNNRARTTADTADTTEHSPNTGLRTPALNSQERNPNDQEHNPQRPTAPLAEHPAGPGESTEASSGRTTRHRLNRGGNRQINRALHIAALAQITRPSTEGHTYYQRCLAKGKTHREAIQALKRRISDRVWTHLQADLQHTKPGPCLT